MTIIILGRIMNNILSITIGMMNCKRFRNSKIMEIKHAAMLEITITVKS